MPQDTTIYWDGYGKAPAIIDTLPEHLKRAVMEMVYRRREELADNDPTFTYIYIAVVFIIFTAIALYYKKKAAKEAAVVNDP